MTSLNISLPEVLKAYVEAKSHPEIGAPRANTSGN